MTITIPASGMTLRQCAEEKLRCRDVDPVRPLSAEETDRLIHELGVHQIELQMQNDELRCVQLDLEVSRASYLDLYERAPVGYLTICGKGLIKKANLSAASMLGVDQNTLLETSLSQFIFPEDQNIYHLHRTKAFNVDEKKDCELRMVRVDDSPFWVHVQSTHPRNGEQWITFTDVSERKRSEEEKKALELQLQQSQKLESLGVLAGGIAHDFNNILAIIMGYCALSTAGPETTEQNIPMIEKAVERAAGLCRQMLAYAGMGFTVLKPVHMTPLVGEVVDMLKATVFQQTDIIFNHDSDIPVIKADDSQVRQIVMNLLINASEAIGKSSGQIEVSIEKTVITGTRTDTDHLGRLITPGSYVCLEVTDNGCGMDDDTMLRIFEPFYTTKFTGRGLGMSSVLGIITAHAGALQLSSKPGHGTTFKVYLPISGTDESKVELKHCVPADKKHDNGTILLAEDEQELTILLTTMLDDLGFTVIAASNGREALELYQKNSDVITLVMTDVGMPVMDGYGLFHELKKLKPELPIVISSGFVDAEIYSRIPDDEIAGKLNKPYSFDQLQDLLVRILKDEYPKTAEPA